MSSSASLCLNPLLGTLSCSLMSHIHLIILICVCWSVMSIILSYPPGLTSMQHTTSQSTAVQFTSYTHTETHTFISLFSRTTSVSRHQKGKPFCILLKQDMMRWQWHQLDHMQIICTTLQTANHVSTHHSIFLWDGCSSWHPTNRVKAVKALTYLLLLYS